MNLVSCNPYKLVRFVDATEDVLRIIPRTRWYQAGYIVTFQQDIKYPEYRVRVIKNASN